MKEVINRIGAFSGLDSKLLSKIADSAIACTYPADEVIIREGDVGVGMYFILRGRVAVFRTVAGKEVRVGEIGPNEFVADMAILEKKPREAGVVTVEETECVLFTRDTFRQIIDGNPSLAIGLVRMMTEKLRAAHELLPARVPDGPAGAEAATDEPAAPGGMKGEVQKKLLDVFEMLYLVKAFTRFSVAILGCPVEGAAVEVLDTIRIGDVKALILPATGTVDLAIRAWGAGQFQLHVFHPDLFAESTAKAVCFDPVPIQPDDQFTLSLPAAVLLRRPVQ